MKYIITVCCFFTYIFTINAQNKPQYTVKGIITDMSSDPVRNASVQIDNLPNLLFSAGENGTFEVKLPQGVHAFEIKSVNCLTERPIIDIQKDTTIIFAMTEIVNQLEQAIITADRATENIRKPVLGVVQLNNKVLKKIPAAFGETDLLRGLQMLPGVSTVGEASNGINVRGGATDQNLLLLDDAPIFNPTHVFGLFSVFPPDATSRAELYKGNVPSRFGGRASAVLDVAIENPSLEKTKFDGGISLISTRGTLSTPLIKEKMGLLTSVRGAFTDFLLPIISKKDFQDTRAKFGEACVKLTYFPDAKNAFFLTGYYSRDFFQTGLLGTIGNINSKLTQNDYSTTNFSLRYLHTFHQNLSLTTTAVYSDYVPNLILPEVGADNKVVLRSSVQYRQLKSHIDYFTKGHQLKIGINGIFYGINAGELIPNNSPTINPIKTPIENAAETAVFVEDNFDITPRISASLGLRYSYFMNLGAATVRSYLPDVPFSDATVTSEKLYKGVYNKFYGDKLVNNIYLSCYCCFCSNYLHYIVPFTTQISSSQVKHILSFRY